jgi:hypothetical protein
VIRVRLLQDSGRPEDALLRVRCAGQGAGRTPSDGVRLAITGGTSFDVPVRGRTAFLLQTPVPSFGLKSKATVTGNK